MVFYLLVTFVGLVSAAALVLWLLYGGSPWPAAPPRVVEGGRLLRVIELDPKGLTIGYEDGGWAVCENFELRVSEDGGVKSLLIRGTFVKDFTEEPDGGLVKSSSEELLYGDAAYAVALDGSFARRVVDAGEWDRARKFGPEELDSEFTSSERRFYFYKGETLPEGGATAGGAPLTRLGVGGAEPKSWLLSEGGRYAAGFSHTSRRRPLKLPSLIPLFGVDDRIIAGTMYVDLFDGATGERLARAAGGHKGSSDMYVFQQATWFDARYFAMPLDEGFGSWLVGALPE